jgi:Tfp pilus assembly protein PilN
MSTLLATRTRTSVPIVNLLPPEFAEQEKLRKLQMKLGAVLALTLLTLVGGYLSSRGAASSAREELAASRSTSAQLLAQQAQFAEVPQSRARLQAAESTLAKAMTKEILWSTYLRDLSLSVPKGVWLTELAGTVAQTAAETEDPAADTGLGTVSFTGRALKYENVADWLDALEKQKGYSNAWSSDLKQTTAEGETYIEFTSSVNLTEAALAKRSEASTE